MIKREIEFHDGVNILQVNHKQVNHALIDIIDYCLFSSMCTIPKGIIYNSKISIVWFYGLMEND